MFFLYQIILSILILVSPIIIIFRIINNKEDKIRFLEKFSISSKKSKRRNLIWFHGASVGEIMSVIPLIKYYENKKSIDQILITSSTLSSSKILKKYNLKKTIHQFYPIDHIFFVNIFLNYWRPKIAIFIESEIWPCMFKKIEQKKIPLILLNARLTKKTFKKWSIIKSFSEDVFSKIKFSYPQNDETKLYLQQMKSKKVNQIGNLKFIDYDDKSLSKINYNLKSEFNKKKVWVASSTHKDEEIFCAKAHIELKKKVKNLITIIIPRHIHRVKDIVLDLEKLNLKVNLHSTKPKNLKFTDIYLVDTFGETKKFHDISSTVFLGGSIIKRGGQNPLEAARLGSRVLHGSHTDNFKDVYKLLKKFKISKKISSSSDLASSIIFKKNKKNGQKIKNIGEKILKKTINELNNLIINELKKT
tara:strand:- start:444 stop:1694 length:1251 start_codon:yes stop_codon:yes gene_type:complete